MHDKNIYEGRFFKNYNEAADGFKYLLLNGSTIEHIIKFFNLRYILMQTKNINNSYIYGNNLEIYDSISLSNMTSGIKNFQCIGKEYSYF